jgi:hypothetical protein
LRTALEHREPDRIPPDFGSTNVTGIHVSCVAALRGYYGLPPGPVKVYQPFPMLGWIDDGLRAAMGPGIGVHPTIDALVVGEPQLRNVARFVFNATQTPVANIVAMLDAVHKFNGVSHA